MLQLPGLVELYLRLVLSRKEKYVMFNIMGSNYRVQVYILEQTRRPFHVTPLQHCVQSNRQYRTLYTNVNTISIHAFKHTKYTRRHTYYMQAFRHIYIHAYKHAYRKTDRHTYMQTHTCMHTNIHAYNMQTYRRTKHAVMDG